MSSKAAVRQHVHAGQLRRSEAKGWSTCSGGSGRVSRVSPLVAVTAAPVEGAGGGDLRAVTAVHAEPTARQATGIRHILQSA